MPWGFRYKDRLLEWLFSTYTFGFGLWLAKPGEALNPVTLQVVLDMIPEHTWALLFILIGFVHVLSLAINGAAWWTPFARCISASFNFVVYLVLTYSIWLGVPDSSGVFTYGYLVEVGLGIIIFRSARDCFVATEGRLWPLSSRPKP